MGKDFERNGFRLPDLDADETEILTFRDRWFNYNAVYRCRNLERLALNIHYQLGHQWIELDTEVLLDGARGYVFKETRARRSTTAMELPKPVTNIIAPAVEIECASLGKQQLVPNVRPTSKDPKIQASARNAKEILDARLKDLDWPGQRELATFLTVVTGTSVMRSWWDETHLDTIVKPVDTAVSCQSCGTVLASSELTQEDLQAHREFQHTDQATPIQPEPGSGAPGTFQLSMCPQCPDPYPLQPYQPSEEEANDRLDILGKPMGKQVPKGNTNLEVVSPFDVFPQNSGVGVTVENCRVWGQATVRDMDWVEEHWPEAMLGDDPARPEDPTILMKIHPILGQWNLLGFYSQTLDSGIYENHARVYDIHVKPNFRFPEGRSIIIVGDKKIVFNGELNRKTTLADGTILKVPRAFYAGSVFKTRHGEFWGQSLVDDLISPQNRINGMDAQIIEARERTGSPNLLASEAMNLSGPEWYEEYGSGKLMKYSTDPLNPAGKPEVFGSILFPSGVYQERDRLKADSKEIAGPQEIEIGEAPKNITTTSGLQLLGEQAERRRAARERSLNNMFEKVWKHQLDLLWTLRTDEDSYEVKSIESQWERKAFTNLSIMGQTKVEIEKQAEVEKSIWQREGTREAQADGLYVVDSAVVRKRLLEIRGLPTDVNDDLNYQVENSEHQWSDFCDTQKLPIIDQSLDDPTIHWKVLSEFLLSDKGQQMSLSVGWPSMLKILTGWEDTFHQAEAQDAMTLQFYGGRVPQQQADEFYAQAVKTYQQNTDVWMSANAQAQSASPQPGPDGTVPPPPPGAMQTLGPKPMPPPPPVFLPPAIEDRIYGVWMTLLKNAPPELQQQLQQPAQDLTQPTMDPNAPKVNQDNFMKFRAVAEGYRILAAKLAMPPPVPGGAGPQAPGQPGLEDNQGPNPATPPVPANAPGQAVNQG